MPMDLIIFTIIGHLDQYRKFNLCANIRYTCLYYEKKKKKKHDSYVLID